jgi:hypothetical protein
VSARLSERVTKEGTLEKNDKTPCPDLGSVGTKGKIDKKER